MKLMNRIVAGAVGILFAGTVLAGGVQHRNLESMTKMAKRVFVGTCVAVDEHYVPGGISYTEYTFEIKQVLKGEVGSTLTFRQFGLVNPVQVSENLAYVGRVSHMPVYQKDVEYMLFLIGDSRLGLTSPVGLMQGAFRVFDGGDGKQIVNSVNNMGLFKDMEAGPGSALAKASGMRLKNSGPHRFDQFVTTVETLAAR